MTAEMTRRSFLLAGVGLAGALGVGAGTAACTSPPPVTPPSDLVFNGDFETGDLTQWATTHTQGGDTEPEIVTNNVRAGSKYACLFALSGSQYRNELEIERTGSYVQREGTDLYYGWSVRFAGPFPVGPWQVAGQWHSNVNNGDEWDDASPPLSVTMASTLPGLDPSRWYIDSGRNSPMDYPVWSYDLGPMVFDRWVDLVTRTVLSTDPERGLLQVWIDGRLVVDAVPPAPLLYPTTNPDRYNYLKVGYYRDDSIEDEGEVWFDNVRIGRTYESVDPSAT